MRNPQQKPVKYQPTLKDIVEGGRFVVRYRSHPDTLGPFLASLKNRTDITEENLSALRNAFIALRTATLDHAVAYRADKYLTLGMGAVDLALIPVILPLGAPDGPLFIAVLCLVISLVLVSTSLFVNFVKSDAGITSYGHFHSTLVTLSLFSGAAALVSTVWHISSLIAAIFLALMIIAYLACAGYLLLVRWAIDYYHITQSALSTDPTDAGSSDEPQPKSAIMDESTPREQSEPDPPQG